MTLSFINKLSVSDRNSLQFYLDSSGSVELPVCFVMHFISPVSFFFFFPPYPQLYSDPKYQHSLGELLLTKNTAIIVAPVSFELKNLNRQKNLGM